MVRNSRTHSRIAKMIKAGKYDQEILILDMTDFLHMGTLTEAEFADLMELMEQYPSKVSRMHSINEEGHLISDNTYLLLTKQIIKSVYSVETIEQLTTDFRLTGAITRDQFNVLSSLIEEIYFPSEEEELEEEFEKPSTLPGELEKPTTLPEEL